MTEATLVQREQGVQMRQQIMAASASTRLPERVPVRRLALGLLFTVAVMGLLVSLVDLERIGTGLLTVLQKPGTVAVAALAYTTAFWLRALAWRLLMASPVSTAALFSILQAGLLLNHVLPMKAGEFSRPLLLLRRGVPFATAITTTVLARALDVVALLVIAVVANGSLVAAAMKPVALAGVVLAAGLLIVVRMRHFPSLPEAVRGRLVTALDALRAITARRLAASMSLVLLSWTLEAGMLIAAARLLDLDLAVSAAVGVTAFTILFQVVHITPGGLGLYEASMTGILVLHGMPAHDALALAVLTHGLKFGYSLTVAPICAVPAGVSMFRGRAAEGPQRASRFEITAARLWNVLNEGKPFTPVFALGVLLLLGIPHLSDGAYWVRASVALLAVVPLALVFWRFDFPLRLRSALWVYVLGFLVLFRFVDVAAVALVLSAYLLFTVVLWGTIYYHLRIGTPWTNGLRFWRLVLENPDPTSGNFLEQVPKLLLLVLAFGHVSGTASWPAVLGVEGFTAVIAISALLIHQRWFTWVPALPQRGYTRDASRPERTSKRVIVIAIDGCRDDRLREAHTPFIDRLRAEGADYTDVSTVYPARTVTCFASMLTGAAPAVHGMRSNFVPSLGVKCESVFDVLRRGGMRGVLVGIAHLVDAFGERDVRTVTAVMDNDEIDGTLIARAKRVLEEEGPDLLVLQLLSVDQTGHARGSYHGEYLAKIEETDRAIEGFIGWCEEHGYLDGATVLLTADHGQGKGIGGHGHMSPPEITVPCIWWGAGVTGHRVMSEPRFITEIAPTICYLLGAPSPADTVGRALLSLDGKPTSATQPVIFVIPAHNEEANLPGVLAAIARAGVPGSVSVVVDDGSSDATARVAEACGAVVVRHAENRGLGAALRTGLAVARDLDARAVVYLDADGEYDPTEAPRLLEPIERGEADYVLGSRFRGTVTGMTHPRRFANAAFSLLLSVLCGRWVSDGQTGMRAFSRRAVEVAEIVHDYNYAQVLTLDLLQKGMRMTEVPISYRRRRHGRSFIDAQYLWRVPLGIAREMFKS